MLDGSSRNLVRGQEAKLSSGGKPGIFALGDRRVVNAMQDDHHIIARAQLVCVQPVRGAEDALGPVAGDRAPDAALNPQPQAGHRQLVRQRPDGQQRPAHPAASTTNREESLGQPQPFERIRQWAGSPSSQRGG